MGLERKAAGTISWQAIADDHWGLTQQDRPQSLDADELLDCGPCDEPEDFALDLDAPHSCGL